MAPFPTPLFSTVHKHTRFLKIGQPQIWKRMKLSQLEKPIQKTLPNWKDRIQKWPNLLALKWPGQINAQPSKWGHSWVSCGNLSRGLYVTCPKIALPAGNTFAQGLLFKSKWRPGTVQIKSIPGVLGWPFKGSVYDLSKNSLPLSWKYNCLRALVHLSQS